jgi:hypothetical protein
VYVRDSSSANHTVGDGVVLHGGLALLLGLNGHIDSLENVGQPVASWRLDYTVGQIN